MKPTRRQFINRVAAATAGATLIPQSTPAGTTPLPDPRIKLSISSYSYWHFKGDKFPIEKVIDEAARNGVEGIDVLHRQMASDDNAYLQKIKKHAFVNSIALTCLSIHQSFVSPDREFL